MSRLGIATVLFTCGLSGCVWVAADDGGTVDGGGDPIPVDSGQDAGASGTDGGSDSGMPDAGWTQSAYDRAILADAPVAYWTLNQPGGTEPDLTGNGVNGTYAGGSPTLTTMPNGDSAADFDGVGEYLTVPSTAAMSISTTGSLTWEGWIRPDALDFPTSPQGYVYWMGKCATYSPTCEWGARMYDTTNPQARTNRLSAYAYNSTAGTGSGADWQPADAGIIQAGAWYHVVGEYTTLTQPAVCATPPPGSINIWVNGVSWSQSHHGQTGCMSQYGVTPTAQDSPLNIGTMALDAWFQGAVGKVALYDHLLTDSQIASHYQAMTGRAPAGSCGNDCVLQ